MNLSNNTKAVPANPTTRYHWVRYRLVDAGSNFADLAAENGVSVQAVCNALRQPSARLEDAIAAKIGLTAREIFPERFDADGNRLSRPRKWKRSTGWQAGPRSNGAAA